MANIKKFEIFKTGSTNPKQKFGWRLVASTATGKNRKIIAAAGEGFSSRQHARRSIDNLATILMKLSFKYFANDKWGACVHKHEVINLK